MKASVAACLALFVGSVVPAVAIAADSERPLPETDLAAPFHTNERTYFREHRLRAYERTRAGTSQGATCVTPKGVCWIAEPLSNGNDCSCESRRLGTIHGLIGG
ncbi:hypothetical protein [Microvirga mediterraneensis]|uniref:Secreted protein n=1 Tax=Microvirga mediterraneensis TaxID=2754695 RepID=A0A838BLY9_9HYPH|nr:hypothetical protein [Microvirga mediterraneensis]MBA1156099.1 hypothetical protein [Microvirga mediterraneensis]